MRLLKYLASIGIAMAIGFLAYSTVTNYYLARTLENRALMIQNLEGWVLQSLFTYGVVQSVDPAKQSLTISLGATTSITRNITVLVTENTLINRQELLADQSGVYVGISDVTPGTFSDLVSGTKIAVTFKKSGDVFEATLILFGNPL